MAQSESLTVPNATPPAPTRAVRWSGLTAVVVTVLPLITLVVLWWLISAYWLKNPLALPTPSATWHQAVTLVKDGTLGDAILTTARSVVVSFALAVATGVPLGVLIGRVPWVQALLRPVISFLFTAPKSAFYPAITILFGLGSASKIAFGFVLAFFQVVIATASAASQVETRLTWSGASLGSSRMGVFWRIVVPATGPGAVAGARVGLVGAIVGVFLGELVSGASGLGQMMVRARTALDSPTVYVTIVIIAVMAVVFDALVVAASRRLFRWAED